jgi:ethanolamine ammonia-lyase large subunit
VGQRVDRLPSDRASGGDMITEPIPGHTGVPGADDVMLAYQSTSFHDALYLREVLGLRPAPEFEAWLNRMGIFDGKNALAGPRLATPLLGTVRRLAEDGTG